MAAAFSRRSEKDPGPSYEIDRSDTMIQCSGVDAGGYARAGLTTGGRVIGILEGNPRRHVKHGHHDAFVIPWMNWRVSRFVLFLEPFRSQQYCNSADETSIIKGYEACNDPGSLERDDGIAASSLRM